MLATGHDIGDTFGVNDVVVTLTSADHAWQNARRRLVEASPKSLAHLLVL